jgi:hypothetical protein
LNVSGYNSFSGVFADGILPEIDRLHCGSRCISTPNTNCSSTVNGVVVTRACTPIYSIRGNSVTFTNSRAEKNQRVFMDVTENLSKVYDPVSGLVVSSIETKQQRQNIPVGVSNCIPTKGFKMNTTVTPNIPAVPTVLENQVDVIQYGNSITSPNYELALHEKQPR